MKKRLRKKKQKHNYKKLEYKVAELEVELKGLNQKAK